MYDILVKYSSTLFFGPYILRNVNGHNAAELMRYSNFKYCKICVCRRSTKC